MMGVLFFLVFMLILVSNIIKSSKMQERQKKGDFLVEEVVKNCPPHKWRHLEVKDTEGNTVRWKMVCDLCGPLKPASGPARME
jgi:hypothetical protein